MDIKKYIAVEKELSETYGPFKLFALFLTENALYNWDLVVAADWLDRRSMEDLKLIIDKLREHLDKKEMLDIAKVVILEKKNAELDAIAETVNIEHGRVEMKNPVFFDLSIRHAIFITSQRTDQKEYA